MLDLENIKLGCDLLAITGHDTQLKKIAQSGGGEWAGPCPWCGGRDRFRVQPYANPGRWLCRNCTAGKWQDVIAYIGRRDNLDASKKSDLIEICKRATGGNLQTMDHSQEKPVYPAYAPPEEPWQLAAAEVIAQCQDALWQPKYHQALDYLRGRGLTDQTIQRFKLGYCATGDRLTYRREISGMRVWRGIVIPLEVQGTIWAIKIRLLPGVPCRCIQCGAVLPTPGACTKCGKNNKYNGVKGNKTAAIYNADSLAGSDMALMCEGEFDCMIAHQELNDVIPCITMGSSANRPDMATWAKYLLPLGLMLAAYDTDDAGEAGANALASLSKRIKRIALPAGIKDINEYHQAGGNLWDWISPYLPKV